MADEEKVPVVAPVSVVAPVRTSDPAQVGDKNIAPNTTAADDKRTDSQQAINHKWESTQQIIAILTTVCVLAVTSYMILRGDASEAPFLLLSNVLVLVLTNYFQRTNHQKTGGVQKGDAGR